MKIVINPKYKDLTSFVNSVPERFDQEGVTIHLARNIIKVFVVGNIHVNIKQYRIPDFLNRLIYTFFRPSKASRAYDFALKLLSKGFNTPEPVAYLQLTKGGLIHRSYFISIQCPFTRNMYEFGKGNLDGRENIIRTLARYTASLHEAGIYHKDYSPGNILFNEKGSEVSFCLIDINRMEFAPVSIRKGCANFERLWGKRDMFRMLAEEYAKGRKADTAECIKLVLYYRDKFWTRYARKHDITFEL